ncbi:MAG: enoyl-CoA hydratase [Chloroflexi bacterium]|jgi:enoyl-CoA hydratase/carnithine racemase|nr:MAG: enoyl-CoA hydratase [Chloroflexota bacterium]
MITQSDFEFKKISTLQVSIKNQVGLIRIKGRDQLNLIDDLMVAEIKEVINSFDDNPNVRAIVLSSVGDNFSAGSTVKSPPRHVNLNSQRIAFDVANVRKITIASLRGKVLDQGLELALACDIRFASSETRFGLTHIKNGSIPWDGGTQRLPRVIGPSRALYMMLTGVTIDAIQALEYGLVSQITSEIHDEELALEFGLIIASHGPIAVQYLKEAVNSGSDLNIEEGMRLELDLATLLHSTNDRAEGLRAFAEKRKPEFKGD